MALHPIPYERLDPLLREYLSTAEDAKTAELIRQLQPAGRRRYLIPAELEAVCYWKSPRAIRLIRGNAPDQVRRATRSALRTRNERRRLEALTRLKGVSVPMASALLMLVEPRHYGVIDIRVWQVLHKLGTVRKNPRWCGVQLQELVPVPEDHQTLCEEIWGNGPRRGTDTFPSSQAIPGRPTVRV